MTEPLTTRLLDAIAMIDMVLRPTSDPPSPRLRHADERGAIKRARKIARDAKRMAKRSGERMGGP